jgi:hypothetical protein
MGAPAAAPSPRRRAGTLEALRAAIEERDGETSRELMRRRVG